jgi:HEPN domain-containing protein
LEGEREVIAWSDLRNIARARLRDAEILLSAQRYDGAVYLCGYSVEIALKARTCRALGWSEFPETSRDFEGYQSLRTHRLDVLLHFSGAEARIKRRFMAEWSIVAMWEPDARYRRVGTASVADAADMIRAARSVVSAL